MLSISASCVEGGEWGGKERESVCVCICMYEMYVEDNAQGNDFKCVCVCKKGEERQFQICKHVQFSFLYFLCGIIDWAGVCVGVLLMLCFVDGCCCLYEFHINDWLAAG